ncbi:hypothetical protein TNCV_3554901 [Trichonephila clavipes]|nr:hypothetical protein TNCV_3554901 [Trichonephila clavipes]
MGKRSRGRSPLRWIDCVEKDLNILMVKNWKTELPKAEMPGEGQSPPRAVEPMKKRKARINFLKAVFG